MDAVLRRRAIVGGVVGAVVGVVVIAAVLAQKRPPQCDPQMRSQVAALEKAGFALRSARAAGALADKALDAADRSDGRFFLLRRYDGAACAAAQKAVADAVSAAADARVNKDRAAAAVSAANAGVDEAKRQLASATAWLEAGVVADDIVQKVRAAKKNIEQAGQRIERARGSLDVAGWEGSTAELDAAGVDAAAQAGEARAVAERAKAEGMKRCAPKRGGAVDVDGVTSFESWLLLSGPEHVLLFNVDHDAKKCAFLHDVKRAGAKIVPGGAKDEKLFEWHIPGALMPTTLLVGWSEAGAWFVTRDGDYRAFLHRHPAKCAARSCGPPEIAARAIDARCACDDAHFDVHYSWDGNTVVAED